MSQKRVKCEYAELNNRTGDRRPKKHINLHSVVDSKHKENVVKRLAELFQDSFDLDLIQSVAQTCQWDFGKSTEALIVLGGSTQPPERRTRRINSLVEPCVKYKTKSLPSTLKGHKSQSGCLSDSSTRSMPNGLRPHPAHMSNDSLSSGQVWQRHYKSKPQSPGLLTMITPNGNAVKVVKPGSRSSSRPTSRPSSQASMASMIKENPEVKKTSAVILRIQQLIQNNVKVMVLMRGVPGSGKTHLAQVVVGMVTTNDFNQHIFSTDDYFVMLGRGVYNYDPSQLMQAHNWNQKRVSEALRRATNPVLVDNTNTQAWEMRPYVTMAVQNGYLIEVLEPVTPWKTKEAELARRNVHNVPREKIGQMLDRFEPGWTGDKLLNLFQLKYQHCGAAHVSPELTGFSNSPLAQHRQHAVLEQPEKPKRKRNGTTKKDRRQVPGLEIRENQEQQLAELNKLFAEYGKTIDPESRQKVLEAGVPIYEVVSRIRKLQGTLLPMPGIPPSIMEEGLTPPSVLPTSVVPEVTELAPAPDYLGLHRRSPTDSVEPDTMSSSSGSPESSECNSDSEAEPLRRYLDDCAGHFVDGEDQWEDEEEAKSDGAVSGKPGKISHLVTSSQEELSIIDYQISTPAGSSQDELSLLEFERGESPNRSSSSSEDPKTELSTLQDSLRDVLLRSAAQQFHSIEVQAAREQLLKDIVEHTSEKSKTKEKEQDVKPPIGVPVFGSVDLNDSLLEILKRRFAADDTPPIVKPEPLNGEITNMGKEKTAKSPDLEEMPLPCIPREKPPISAKPKKESASKLETIAEVNSAVQSPPDNLSTSKEEVLAAKKDKSPEKLLQNFDLNWASIPITGSWEGLQPKDSKNSQPQRKEPLQKTHIEVQTVVADFDLWKVDAPPVPILMAVSRPINSIDTPLPTRSLAGVAMLDKGCMTIEEAVAKETAPVGNDLQDLLNVFPGVPVAEMADLLEKCQGDKGWVAELLLDPSFTYQPVEAAPLPLPTADAQVNDFKRDGVIADGKKTIKRRKDKKGASEISQLLKKEIEESIQIGEEHYTDKILFIKKLRSGDFNMDVGTSSETQTVPEAIATYSAPIIPVPGVSTSTMAGLFSGHETVNNIKEEEGEELEEEQIAMTVDSVFLETLVQKFGGAPGAVGETKGYKPTILVPESLARQLYWLWVETVNHQVAEMQIDYEDMLQEDELLASALQDLEIKERPPNMQEIMDSDIAMTLHRKDQVRLGEKKEETAASKLSRQLLFEAYPHLDKQTLMEVFRSEGCSLQRTCQTLSLVYGPPRTAFTPVEQPPCLEAPKEIKHKPIIIVREPGSKATQDESDILVVDPSKFRREIQTLQMKRSDCLCHGQEAVRKKSYSAASYFYQLASEYKEKIKEANQSSISLQLFSGTGSRTSTTIDLHYLWLPEAVQIVDLFLDHHIAQLQTGRLDLYLITGRGQRSVGGRSRIKPAVVKRLEDRQLSYVEDNPGMIRVTVHPNDLLSSAL